MWCFSFYRFCCFACFGSASCFAVCVCAHAHVCVCATDSSISSHLIIHAADMHTTQTIPHTHAKYSTFRTGTPTTPTAHGRTNWTVLSPILASNLAGMNHGQMCGHTIRCDNTNTRAQELRAHRSFIPSSSHLAPNTLMPDFWWSDIISRFLVMCKSFGNQLVLHIESRHFSVVLCTYKGELSPRVGYLSHNTAIFVVYFSDCHLCCP